jgi:trans-aconitate methyltransferase
MADPTVSLTSSILNYTYENGRRYHAYKAGNYPIPNDEREQDRLDLQHHIYSMLLEGELYTAPLESAPRRVLDVGTGTGIWAMDLADRFPDCQIIGSDLSAIQPTIVPQNLQFEIDDCEQEWLYSQPFDFIHMRSLGGSIADWPKLLRRAYDNLVPGGWLQVTEFETWCSTDDDSLPKNAALHLYMENLVAAAVKFGKVMNIAPEYERLLNEAGFEHVVDTTFKV